MAFEFQVLVALEFPAFLGVLAVLGVLVFLVFLVVQEGLVVQVVQEALGY